MRDDGAMLVHDDSDLVGEVHCLNCGRTLAEAIRNPLSGKLRLRPALNQASVQVELTERRELRCGRCHGRALVEPLIQPGIQVRGRGRHPIQPLQGAARAPAWAGKPCGVSAVRR